MPSRSEFAVRFALVSIVLLAVAIGLSAILMQIFPVPTPRTGGLPIAFIPSTILLAAGSYSLSRARAFVRRERQAPFRRCLLLALGCGTLFVTTQSYALVWLMQNLRGSGSLEEFVTAVAALHAMHFVIALLFLVHVSVQAFADRYDHEYSWGVTVCVWFWHFLGGVWLLLLGLMGIGLSLQKIVGSVFPLPS